MMPWTLDSTGEATLRHFVLVFESIETGRKPAVSAGTLTSIVHELPERTHHVERGKLESKRPIRMKRIIETQATNRVEWLEAAAYS